MLTTDQRECLTRLCHALIDQTAATVVVEPQQRQSGFWFGGGNMIEQPDGSLCLVGRYRNAGDSRTGVAAGTRGLELAIFRSDDQGHSFRKTHTWSKCDLNNTTGDVLSIEGSCLRHTKNGVELFVSTEKSGVPYPQEVTEFLKPGTGVWTIDVLRAPSVDQLTDANVEPAFGSALPEHLHVKDPFFWATNSGDRLGFCSHPFGWSSSNTGIVDIPQPGESATDPHHTVFPRGTTWDVAMTRGTSVLPVPRMGIFAHVDVKLLFYCGGECLRPLDQHTAAVSRPRGHSCEEIGGAAVIVNDDLAAIERLSALSPMFISPYGTGCSRYVDALNTADGIHVTWQQSRTDASQPLVHNFVPQETIRKILSVVG